ncbi:MAG: response regulator [Novosphingobium sp.]|jgi:CheY-like chemotaxis protein|nr:response regulator [Novosphingobium sp.]
MADRCVAAGGRTGRILIVEDEMLIRELAAEDLTGAGFDVVCACSGDEALAVIEHDSDFDFLFTDIHMPGAVDGRELAVRARARLPGLAVLYATGHADAIGALAVNERCVDKPYVLEDVLQLLASLRAGPR